MNYGKRGISKVQKSLTSKTIKFQKLFFVSALKVILVAALSTAVIGICLGIGAFKGILSSAPDVDPSTVLPRGFATVVYDAKGNELTKLVAANSNRSNEKMDRIPQYLADAFVAIEDKRFYEHNGIDIQGIIRAAFIVIQERTCHRVHPPSPSRLSRTMFLTTGPMRATSRKSGEKSKNSTSHLNLKRK